MVNAMVKEHKLEKSVGGDLELWSGVYQKMQKSDLNTENYHCAK